MIFKTEAGSQLQVGNCTLLTRNNKNNVSGFCFMLHFYGIDDQQHLSFGWLTSGNISSVHNFRPSENYNKLVIFSQIKTQNILYKDTSQLISIDLMI